MARKIYTQEFKEQAVKLGHNNGKSVAETAADLGLPANMLHRWRREAKRNGRVLPGYGKPRYEEMAELRKRLMGNVWVNAATEPGPPFQGKPWLNRSTHLRCFFDGT
jgi:transposase-like protein